MAILGEVYAIGNMLLSGVSAVIVKAIGKDLKPAALILIQSIVSSISFIVITAIMGDFMLIFQISWIALLPLVIAALFGIVLGNLLYFNSLQMIGVSKAYPISMTYPLLTYLFEVIIFPDTSFMPLKLIGIVVVIIGVVFISLSKVNNKNGVVKAIVNEDVVVEEVKEEDEEIIKISNETTGLVEEKFADPNNKKLIFGVILSALAAVTWASGTLLIKFGLQNTDIDIIPINAARMFFLVPVSIPIFFAMNRGEKKSKFSWKSVLLAILASIFSLVISNILYLLAIDLIGASTPAAIAASGPLVATPLAVLFLKEKVDWKIILGTVFTIGGIIMVILLG